MNDVRHEGPALDASLHENLLGGQGAKGGLRVLLAQVESEQRDVDANTDKTISVLNDHRGLIDLAVFPELFLGGYQLTEQAKLQLTVDSPEVRRLQMACARSGIALIVGFHEAGGYNSLLAIDADGRLAGVYRKTHLFGPEAAAFEPGDRLLNVKIHGAVVGVSICFDIEFPEVARTAVVRGAQLLVSIAANMHPYYPDHELASRARALENRVPHIYVNSCGASGPFNFVGGSRVVDSGGTTIIEAASSEELTVTRVNLLNEELEELSYLQHRRLELYG